MANLQFFAWFEAWVDAARMGNGMDQLEVEGLRIAYERAGEGPPLILLHGFVGDSREWRRQIDGLSDEFTVEACYHVGHRLYEQPRGGRAIQCRGSRLPPISAPLSSDSS